MFLSAMFTFLSLSALVAALSASINGSTQDLDCPLWTFPINGTCRCGDDYRETLSCEDDKGALLLKKCFCMTARPGEHFPIVGTCLYRCDLTYPETNVIGVNTTAEITNMTCGPFRRAGVMCGECMPGYGLPVYSYSLSCVECVDYKFNWLIYITVAYLPLTIFFIMVIILRISVTSGFLLGYVTICQLLTMKSIATLVVNFAVNSLPKKNIAIESLVTMLSFWNLDFFRALYPPFCLHPHLTALQVQSLDYLIAVYPLVLIFLIYGLVELHNCFHIVICLCRPFYRCLHLFIREWDIKTSLVGSLTTFYLLSYVKVMNVSADILTSTTFYAIDGTFRRTFYYFNASVPYFGSEHLPYATLAIVVTCLFNIFPLLLLLLYPCRHFQRCLNKVGCSCHVLHVLMDAILGSYSHKPRERRYFGAFYLLVRFVHVFTFSAMNPLLYLGVCSYFMVVVVVCVTAVAPYKNKWHTVIDVVLFSAILHASMMIVIFREGMFVAPVQTYEYREIIYNLTAYASSSVVPVYGVVMLVGRVLPWKYLRQKVTLLVRNICRQDEEEDPLPFRIEQEERALLINKV